MPRVNVIAVDEDGSPVARRLLAALAAEPSLRLHTAPGSREEPPAAPFDRVSAEAAVRAGKVPIALIVPEGFGAQRPDFVGAGQETTPLLLLADSANPIAPQVVKGMVQKVSFTVLGDLYLGAGVEALDLWGVDFTPAQRERLAELTEYLATREEGGNATKGSSGPGGGEMLIPVTIRDLTGEEKERPLVTFYASGLGVMVLLFSAAGAGGALIEERESGTLDRLLSTRLTMRQLLTGKLLFLFSMGFVQISLMFLWGQLVYGVDSSATCPASCSWRAAPRSSPRPSASSSPPSVAPASSSWRSRTRDPLDLGARRQHVPALPHARGLQKASLLAFNSWALEGFLDVFWRGQPLTAALPEAAVLLAGRRSSSPSLRVARKWERVWSRAP